MVDSRPSRGFIRHLHAFRGFAIIGVVSLHSCDAQLLYFGGSEPTSGKSLLDHFTEILFHDSTNYFALISGLLFSLALRRRGWQAFFRSKAANVLVPYVLMTLLYTLHGSKEEHALFGTSGDLDNLGPAFVTNLLRGSAFYHLWYIPVFLSLCVATPLLVWLLDRPKARWALGALVILPLFVSRTGVVFSWQSVVYYLGIYTSGMFVGANYENASHWLERHWRELVTLAVVTTLALVMLFRSGIDTVGITSIRESLFYVQKLALSGVVLVAFRLLENRLPEWLMKVSGEAFPIYFLHPLILIALYQAQLLTGLAATNAVGLAVSGFVWVSLTIGAALLVTWLARLALGKRSRVLIGA